MFCDKCGTLLHSSVAFCPGCGKSVIEIPLVPARGRIAGHLRLLGILWVALSGLRLIPGIILIIIASMVTQFLPSNIPGFVPMLIYAVITLLWVNLLAGAIVGWGLITRESWARMAALVLGCLNMMDLFFGTALGVYTLWVLLPAKSEQEYEAVAKAA
jgi:hypothetical protein